MYLNGFYAKDENIISAMYNEDTGSVEILLDPCLHDSKPVPDGNWQTKNMCRYSIPCTDVEFEKAVRKLDFWISNSVCSCKKE